jgi:hypothetical protein
MCAMTAPSTTDKPRRTTRARCTVCKSEHRPQYHALKVAGLTANAMEAESRKLGKPIKAETFRRHFAECLDGMDPASDMSLAQQVDAAAAGAHTQAELDFASLVQKRAAQMLEAGELRVTASHGLQAQALLDRRAEKQADRDFSLNLARLMSGAVMMTPSEVIEGRAIDVTPLAPAALIEPRA